MLLALIAKQEAIGVQNFRSFKTRWASRESLEDGRLVVLVLDLIASENDSTLELTFGWPCGSSEFFSTTIGKMRPTCTFWLVDLASLDTSDHSRTLEMSHVPREASLASAFIAAGLDCSYLR